MLLPEEKKNKLFINEWEQSFELCHHQKGKLEVSEAAFAEQGWIVFQRKSENKYRGRSRIIFKEKNLMNPKQS